MKVTTVLSAIRNQCHRADLRALAQAFRHGDMKVTAILCMRCGTWVNPRRYDPRYDVCTACVPAAKADHRAWVRATERKLGLS